MAKKGEESEPAEIATGRWHVFKARKLEAAYRQLFRARMGTTRNAVLFSGGLVLLFLVIIVVLASYNEWSPDRVAFAAVCGFNVAVAAACLVVRAASPNLLAVSHAVAALLTGLSLSALALAEIWVLTESAEEASSSSSPAETAISSSSSSVEHHGIVRRTVIPFPIVFLVAMSHLIADTWFLIFSALPWPQSFWVALASWIANLVSFVTSFVCPAYGTRLLFSTGLILFGGIIAFLFAASVNQERRDDLASSLLLERELGLVSAEKVATDGVVNALFPPGIAERLLSSKVVAEIDHGDLLASVGDGFSVGSVGTHVELKDTSSAGQLSSPRAFVHEVIADNFKAASVLFVSIDGVESVRPYESQLQLLSELFIAADHVAETHGAVKIKSVGTALEFACGIPTPDASNTHATKCCNLAVDLLRMLRTFCKERGIADAVSLRIGIATGPVVAGVIGLSRPRYDVWGYTTTVAEKLMEIAPKWTIFTTRDVATAAKNTFKFRLAKGTTVIQGLGKIPMYTLHPGSAAEQHIVLNTTPVSFALPRVRQQALWDVAKQNLRTKKDIGTLPVVLFFRKLRREKDYLAVYTAKNLSWMRWFSLALGLVNIVYMLYSVLQGFFTLDRWIVNSMYVALQYAMFGLTFVKPLVARPTRFWITETILMAIDTILCLIMWDTRMWVDATLSGMVAFIFYLSASRVHFASSLAFNVVLFFGTLYMYTNLGYNRMTMVFHVSVILAMFAIHYDHELQSRRVFATGRALAKVSRTTRREREKAKALLTTVIPEKILDKLMHATQDAAAGSTASYLTEFVPSGTVLVVQIVGFDELYRRCTPSESVELLNSLFSHLDNLTRARGLEPLKTIADEYVVVGNLLNDSPDGHAEKCVGLASDILMSLEMFNTTINPTSVPIALRIGIHTDSILTGVIRQKSFLFDVWGQALPLAEDVCSATRPNTAAMSASTLALLPDQPVQQPEPIFVLNLGATTIAVFQVTGAEVPLMPGLLHSLTSLTQSPAAYTSMDYRNGGTHGHASMGSFASIDSPSESSREEGFVLGSTGTAAIATTTTAAEVQAPPSPAAFVPQSPVQQQQLSPTSAPIEMGVQFVPINEEEATATSPSAPIEVDDGGVQFVAVDE